MSSHKQGRQFPAPFSGGKALSAPTQPVSMMKKVKGTNPDGTSLGANPTIRDIMPVLNSVEAG